MAWGSIDPNPAWDARLQADVTRLAWFLFLDWPSGQIRVSTHYRTVTALDEDWTGVGQFASIKIGNVKRNGALVTVTVGLQNLPADVIDGTVQNDAIGRDGVIYCGLFDEAWQDVVLDPLFTGVIHQPGKLASRREDGRWVTNASLEISNGLSPRHAIENHYSEQTAEPGDTAWRHTQDVARSLPWPTAIR
ncbi:MAG: hypothetical protein AAF183_13035 [Pseudomonadota bacterium]